MPIAVLRPDGTGSFSEVKLANYDTIRYAPALGANEIGASMKESSRRVQRIRGRDCISADRRSVVSVQSDNPAPTYVDRPIGIDATGTRTEFDSLGTVEVPADRYWGAQTQRSLQHFSIGNDHMPIEVYRAYGLIKKACALVNERAGRLEPWRARVIVQAAEEAIAGKLDDQFPLYVWQTGSGVVPPQACR